MLELFKRIFKQVINYSTYKKRIILLLLDFILIDFSLWGAIAIRLGNPWPLMLNEYSWLFLLLPILCFPVFMLIGLYSAVVRYTSLDTIWAIFKATFLASIILCVLVFSKGWRGFPRTVPILFSILALPLLCSTRLLIRYCYCSICRPKSNSAKKVVIYGAGSSGAQISTAFNLSDEFIPVAFIDDSPSLHGRQLNGIKIFNPNDLPGLLHRHSPEMVLLAMPSASKGRVREILNWLEPFPVEVKRLPFLDKLVSNKIGIGDIQDVAIEDLLGRDPIPPSFDLLRSCIAGKSVMVTGAGGSIGSELCRQIARLEPKRLILFERSEYALYQIDRKLQNKYKGRLEIISLLGSVCRKKRVEKVLSIFDVDTIYHAAAYKHVPLVEYNPIEGIQNNVFGTMRTALAALNCNVETFVLISTDKAVRPTNIMGASKRMAELVLQGLATYGNGTRFTMVRFGNVLDSSGSVVPLFRQQILKGGPITITHPEIIRYFMTIPEAVELVLQASAMGEGGEVFVLDMGEPVKILDLAKKMIRLSGLTVRDKDNPEGDIEIVFTGLRPGEKLYEELLIGGNAVATEHPMIKKAEEKFYPWPELKRQLGFLEKACSNFDLEAVRDVMIETIDGYKSQCDFVDPVWLASNQKIENRGE